ncbi:hypothetical protein BD779DRAFT_1546854 [Infundibulicybe gibba]|nr:hypothetical protein BD779DRAFT_1546854 [Infundibulicybe gibba]
MTETRATIDLLHTESSPFSGTADGSQPERFRALALEFSVLVGIATFTATLITSFLSLARDIMDPQNPGATNRHFFDIGMLLALFATGLQLATILIAGRGAALSFREAAEPPDSHPQHDTPTMPKDDNAAALGSPPPSSFLATLKFKRSASPEDKKDKNTVEEFRRYFFVCEQLQLFGTALFFTSILFFVYFMFENHRYPITFYVACFIGAYIVLRTGFWKISALRQDVHLLRGMLPGFLGSPKEKPVDPESLEPSASPNDLSA